MPGSDLDNVKSFKKRTEALIKARPNIGKPGYTVYRIILELPRDQPAELDPKGELTRALAAQILNKYLAEPSVSEIGFRKGGIDLAIADGVMKDNKWKPGDFPMTLYSFTDKGLRMVGGLIANGSGVGRAGGLPGYAKLVIDLKDPIGETVDEVTGITVDGPMPTVEFTTSYAIPAAMEPMKKYLFTGAKKEVVFRKYDDGWRVKK